MNRQRISRAQRARPVASGWLLAIALAGSALAVGCVHTVTLCLATAVLAVAASLAWWGADPVSARPGATLLTFLGITLTAYTALQCVPMPIGWLAVLAPHNADVWARALAPLHQPGPAWAPVTLDPNATRLEVLRGVAYLLAFVTALRVARRREGAAFLGGAIVLTGVVLGAAALLHPAFGAHKLFGVYEPFEGIAQRHLAPLMNPNNLAGYLNLAICLAFAAAFSPEPIVPRAICAAVAVMLASMQVWVASRGGVVTMALGALIVLVIVHLIRTGQDRAVATLSVVAGAAVVSGAALVVLGGSDDASAELLVSDTSKLTMIVRAMRMLPSVPFFGCGRGAFESSFPPFRIDAGYVTFAYPEDVVAQWILEWGLPVAIVGFVVVLIALRPSAVLARSTTAAGAWAGLVALGVQNLGDLGTEIPGLMLAAAVCAAIVVAGAPGKGARWRFELWGRVPRRVAIVGWVAASSAIGLAARGIGNGLYDDQRAVRDAALDRSVSTSAFDEVVREAMLRHPGEPYLPFVAAFRASNTRDDNLMAWLGATLERAAVYGPAHLLLARALVLRSPAQARLEYRTAMEQAPLLEGAILAEVLPLTNSFSDAMELVPAGSDGLAVLENLSLHVANKLPATRVLLNAQIAARSPMKPGPSLSAARDAVEDLVEGEGGASWCEGIQRATCLRDALTKAKQAEELDPSECAAYSLHARARVASGDVSGGLQELEAATAAVTDRVNCLKEFSALARDAGDDERAEAALAKVASIGCVGNVECARELTWVAQQEDEHGNPGKAFAFYKQAHERAPEDDAVLENVAVRAARAGLHAEAAVDYEELARRHPTKDGWRNAAQSEREAAVTGLLRQ